MCDMSNMHGMDGGHGWMGHAQQPTTMHGWIVHGNMLVKCGTSIGGHLYWWTPLQSDTFTWPEGPPSQRVNVEAGMVEALGETSSQGMPPQS